MISKYILTTSLDSVSPAQVRYLYSADGGRKKNDIDASFLLTDGLHFCKLIYMNNMTNPEAAFGKETHCACCGKLVKKPVFSKRLGVQLGKDCLADIQHARSLIVMLGDEGAKAALARDWPRVHERLFVFAKG